MKKIKSASSGFTLVEIAIVLTIIGVLLGSGIMALTGMLNDIRYRSTRDRMNQVANVLALYTQQNLFIPCPAQPPDNSGLTTGRALATCSGSNSQGIVPYQDLGLNVEQVQDSYGNFLTYAVNSKFATNDVQTIPAYDNVTQECRVPNVWVVSGQNRNPRKARFCCAGPVSTPAQDLIVRDRESGGTQLTATRTTNNVASLTTAGASSFVAQNTQTPVFVLVSHGRNGFGAYRPSTSKARYQPPAGISYRPNEVENENDDNVFVSAIYSLSRETSVNAYFDDVVIWRTQDQLLSALGRDSCARP
jgi:prepilin-type N-terminal cleavage/methylation domain-containing protein